MKDIQCSALSLMIANIDFSYKDIDPINKIDSIYKHHKKSIDDINNSRVSDILFNPIFYYTWGEYSLAAISLNDDYYFASKVLKPYTGSPTQLDNFNFKHQLSTGPLLDPYVGSQDNIRDIIKLEDYYKRYCCISQVKLNNSIIIGNGWKVVELAVERIKAKLSECHHSDYLISFNFGWNEINLLIFNDTIDDIFPILSKIHELRLDPEDEEVFKNSIKKRILEQENKESSSEINKTGLFSKIYSTFGFKPDLLNYTGKDSLNFTNCGITCRFHIQPGSLDYFYNFLLNHNIVELADKFKVVNGKGVIVINLRGDFEKYIKIINAIREEGAGSDTKFSTKGLDILKRITTFLHFSNLKFNTKAIDIPILVHQCIYEKLRFDSKRINMVYSILKDLNVPKVLSERIIKLLINYNHAINDRVIFIYFIGIYKHLEKILDSIKTLNWKEVEANRVVKIEQLRAQMDTFEEAIWSRIYQTHLFNEFTDLTTEYTGGIQQVILAYEGLLRRVFKLMNLKMSNMVNPTSELKNEYLFQIISISSSSHVETTEKTFQLNPIFIFQPEIFISVISHEVLNFFHTKNEVKLLEGAFPSNLTKLSKGVDVVERVRTLFNLVLNEYYIDKSRYRFSLDFNIFRIVLIDYFSFVYFYKKDERNYTFWHFANLLQNADYFDSSGRPDPYYLTTSFVRNIFVLKLGGTQYSFDELDKIVNLEQLDISRDKYDDIVSFVNEISSLFDINNGYLRQKLIFEINKLVSFCLLNNSQVKVSRSSSSSISYNFSLRHIFSPERTDMEREFEGWKSEPEGFLRLIYDFSELAERAGLNDLYLLKWFGLEDRYKLIKEFYNKIESVVDYNLRKNIQDSIISILFLIGLIKYKDIVLNVARDEEGNGDLWEGYGEFIDLINNFQNLPISLIVRESHLPRSDSKRKTEYDNLQIITTKIRQCNEYGSFDRTGGILVTDPKRRIDYHYNTNKILLNLWNISTSTDLVEVLEEIGVLDTEQPSN